MVSIIFVITAYRLFRFLSFGNVIVLSCFVISPFFGARHLRQKLKMYVANRTFPRVLSFFVIFVVVLSLFFKPEFAARDNDGNMTEN